MADDPKALLIKISATTELLRQQLTAAEDSVARFEARTNVSLGKVDGHFARVNSGVQKMGTLVKAVIGGAIVGTLVEVSRRALEFAASIGESAQQVGVSARDLQVYRFAATQVGISQDEMDKGLQKFTKSLGEARTGGKEAAKVFKALGFSDEDIRHLDVHDALYKTADGIARVTDRAARATPETKLFGKAGQQLDTLLADGSNGIRQFADDLERTGSVLSDEQIQKADQTADKLAQVKLQLEANIAGVVADNATAILSLANALSQVITFAGRAAEAYQRFKIAQGLALTDTISNGLFVPEAGKAKARRDHGRFEGLRDALDNPDGDAFDPFRGTRNRLAVERANKKNGGAGGLGGVGELSATAPKKAHAKREAVDRFPADLARAQGDELQAQLALAVEASDRARIQRALAAADAREAAAKINSDRSLSGAQKAQLLAIQGSVASAKTDLINRQENEQLNRDSLEIALTDNANQRDLLQGSVALARTAGERRIAELRLLELQIQEEGARQDAIIASSTSTLAEKEIARRRIEALHQSKVQQTASIVRETQSPLASYLDGIPKTAAEVNEALEGIAAQGLQSLNDGIAEAIVSGKSLGSVFHSIANQIISDLIRIAVQRAITQPLANALLGGSSSGGGLFGSIGGFLAGIGHRATGGPVGAGTPYLVGERGPELMVPSVSGAVISNSALRGASNDNRVRIELVDTTGLFETRVSQISAPIASHVGQAAAVAGADLAGARAAVQSLRRLA